MQSKTVQTSQFDHFKKIIGDRHRNGLSVSEFCQLHSISKNQYYYWRVRIEGKKYKSHKKSRQSFVPVTLPASLSPKAEICITLPDSTTISIPGKYCKEYLPIVLQALKGSVCSCN